MGGKSGSAQTVGYWYHPAYHDGLGVGPIDAFLEFRAGDKTAWSGSLTASGTISINAPNLFGGEKDQGGIVGDVDIMFGEATQMPNAYLTATFGDQQPAWRGMTTLAFKGGKYGAMNPYPQEAAYKIRKIVKGWDDDVCWYPETAEVGGSDESIPVYVQAVPYAGLGVEWHGDTVRKLSHIGTTSTHFQMRRQVYSFSGELFSTEEFSIPRLDSSVQSELRLIQNSAEWTQQRRGGIGDANASAWCRNAEIYQRPINPPVGVSTYYSAWATADAGAAFLHNGMIYALGGNSRTYVAAWPVGGENAVKYFSVSDIGNVDSRIALDEQGYVWLAIPEQSRVVKLDGDLNVVEEFSGSIPLNRTIVAYGSMLVTQSSPNTLRVYMCEGGAVTQIGDENVGVDGFVVALGGGYFVWNGGLWRLSADTASRSMNPAHILYYARTQADMGREPTANIDEASFTAAADWFYAQGFGLCAAYDPSAESVDEFEQRICRVAGCSLSRSLTTGKWHIDIANGEYDLESLPILADDDILEYQEQPSLLDSAVNSVSVKYFDPERKETIVTPPTQAPALIDAFGVNHLTLDYPEIPTAELALRVALRELQTRITPTSGFRLRTTRKPYDWRPGTYFRLQAPKRGIADMVCILGEKSTGQLRSGAISITATQDVYSLPLTSFVEVEPGVDTRPSQVPQPITLQRAFEAPYIDVVAALPRAELEALPVDVGYVEAVAVNPADHLDYSMMVQPDGGEYVEQASSLWCPTATVVESASRVDTEFSLADAYLLDQVEVGMPVLWDDEIARVDAIDPALLTITLARGCADTVPATHAAGSRLWFWQAARAADVTEYTDGETVNVKLLTNTGSRQLSLTLATPMAVELAARAARPYPPGRIRINGEAWPSVAFAMLTITGVHRDRGGQGDQLIDTEFESVGPEGGTTYTVRGYLDDVLEHEDADLATVDSEWLPSASGQARIEIEAVRGDLVSWQKHSHTFIYVANAGSGRVTTQGARRATTDGAVRVTRGA